MGESHRDGSARGGSEKITIAHKYTGILKQIPDEKLCTTEYDYKEKSEGEEAHKSWPCCNNWT